jgi:hypothetical protein
MGPGVSARVRVWGVGVGGRLAIIWVMHAMGSTSCTDTSRRKSINSAIRVALTSAILWDAVLAAYASGRVRARVEGRGQRNARELGRQQNPARKPMSVVKQARGNCTMRGR